MGETARREPERIRALDVAVITGLKLRTVQNLAARRTIPSAAKLGRCWTFDESVVRRWIRLKEEEECELLEKELTPIETSIRSGKHGISKCRSTAIQSARAYEQLFSRKRGHSATNGSPS
jgi:predicted DNA-binding transcriptional regulator AlpA